MQFSLGALITSCLLFSNTVFANQNEFLQHDFFKRHLEQRQIFIELSAQLKAGETGEAKKRLHELDGYPLASHLAYLILKQEIKAHPEPLNLLDRIGELKVDRRNHRRLLGSVKARAVALGRWRDQRTVSKLENAPVHPCDDLLAGLKTGSPARFNKATGKLWSEVQRFLMCRPRLYGNER